MDTDHAAYLIASILTGKKDRWEVRRALSGGGTTPVREQRRRRNLRRIIAGTRSGRIRRVWGPHAMRRKGVLE